MNTLILVGGGVVVIGLLIWLAMRGARKRGRVEAERDGLKQTTEHAREAHEIDEDVAGVSGADLDDELRK